MESDGLCVRLMVRGGDKVGVGDALCVAERDAVI